MKRTQEEKSISISMFVFSLVVAMLLGYSLKTFNINMQVSDVVDAVHYASGINDGLKRGLDSCKTGNVSCPDLNISDEVVEGEYDSMTRTCSWIKTKTIIEVTRP